MCGIISSHVWVLPAPISHVLGHLAVQVTPLLVQSHISVASHARHFLLQPYLSAVEVVVVVAVEVVVVVAVEVVVVVMLVFEVVVDASTLLLSRHSSHLQNRKKNDYDNQIMS